MAIKQTPDTISNNKELVDGFLGLKEDLKYMINYIEEDYIEEDFVDFLNEVENTIEKLKEYNDNFYENYMEFCNLYEKIDLRFKKYLYEQE